MLSFNKEFKAKLVAEIIKHREQDKIIQGIYWDENRQKGCAVGCAIHSLNIIEGGNLSTSKHSVYPDRFGIPIVLARLEDRIFEGLSVEDSKTWPENFMSAVPEETDLSLVWAKFAVWLLNDVKQYSKKPEVIEKVADLYLELVEGRTVSSDQWLEARKTANTANTADATYADDAAAYAAYAAYADDAVYAAYATNAADAAYAADDAAAYATYAAAYADDAAYATYATNAAYAAAYAARRKYCKKMADKLIEILKETK